VDDHPSEQKRTHTAAQRKSGITATTTITTTIHPLEASEPWRNPVSDGFRAPEHRLTTPKAFSPAASSSSVGPPSRDAPSSDSRYSRLPLYNFGDLTEENLASFHEAAKRFGEPPPPPNAPRPGEAMSTVSAISSLATTRRTRGADEMSAVSSLGEDPWGLSIRPGQRRTSSRTRGYRAYLASRGNRT
jgi:hypothetical protein